MLVELVMLAAPLAGLAAYGAADVRKRPRPRPDSHRVGALPYVPPRPVHNRPRPKDIPA